MYDFNIGVCLGVWFEERKLRIEGRSWIGALTHGFVLVTSEEFSSTGTWFYVSPISTSLAFFQSLFHLREVLLNYLCTFDHAPALRSLTQLFNFIRGAPVEFLLCLIILYEVLDVLISADSLRSIQLTNMVGADTILLDWSLLWLVFPLWCVYFAH